MKNIHNWDFHFDLILTKVPECWEAHNEMCCPSVGSCGAVGTGCVGGARGCPVSSNRPSAGHSWAWQPSVTHSKADRHSWRSSTPEKTHTEAQEMCEEEKGQRERETATYQLELPHTLHCLWGQKSLEWRREAWEKGRKSVVLMFVFLFLTTWTYSSWQFSWSWICLACDSNW